MKKHLFPQSGKFYKANLHSHCTVSDGKLTAEEMSHIIYVSQQPESLKNGTKALDDYISIIRKEATKRAGGEIDPLLAATEKYKHKLGGKQS